MYINPKLTKFINNPPIFFRAYFNKHYPSIHTEIHLGDNKETMMLLGKFKNKIHNTNPTPIDIVYTWIDNSDLVWQEKYQFHKKQYQDNHLSVGSFTIDDARLENHNGLYYSICFVRKILIRLGIFIWLPIGNLPPNWLHKFKSVFIIHHNRIIDTSNL